MSIHSKLHYEHSFESDAAHVKNSLKIREMHRQMGEPGEACKASTTFPSRNATFLDFLYAKCRTNPITDTYARGTRPLRTERQRPNAT